MKDFFRNNGVLILIAAILLALVVGGHAVGFEIFALLAAPLIFLPTHVEPKIPKWFFYVFYPGHLFVIFLVRTVSGV